MGTNIIEPEYTRSCTRISKLMLIEAGRLRLAEKAREAVTCVAQISDTKKPPFGGLIASLGAKAGLKTSFNQMKNNK